MLAQGNNLKVRDQGRSRGRSRTQDQKTRTISTCWSNPGGISLKYPLSLACTLEVWCPPWHKGISEIHARYRMTKRAMPPLRLGSCGPGKLTEKGKFPKVLRGGCKRSFGPREQRSPKSLLHHPKLLLHRCKMGFGWCKRLFGDLCSLGPKDLLHPPLSTFGNFLFSVNFPGPQLPNSAIPSRKGVPRYGGVSRIGLLSLHADLQSSQVLIWGFSYQQVWNLEGALGITWKLD